MQEFKTVRTPATVSRTAAIASLTSAFPGFKLAKFEPVEKEGKKYWEATLKRSLEELPEPGDAVAPGDDPGDDTEEPADKPEPPKADKPKEDRGDKGGTLEEKIDKLIDVVNKLVDSDKEVHSEMGAPTPKADKIHEEKGDDLPINDKSMVLPAPAKKPGTMTPGLKPSSTPTFAKRRFFTAVRDGEGLSLEQAVAELSAEVGPWGYRVAKVQRNPETGEIVAGVVRKRNAN